MNEFYLTKALAYSKYILDKGMLRSERNKKHYKFATRLNGRQHLK